MLPLILPAPFAVSAPGHCHWNSLIGVAAHKEIVGAEAGKHVPSERSVRDVSCSLVG